MASCEESSQTTYPAENALVQVLMFSLLLVTVALTFQHVAQDNFLDLQQHWALVLSVGLSVIAVSFGAVGLFAYAHRSGLNYPAHSKEVLIHHSFVVLGCLLIGLELVFMTVTFVLTSAPRPHHQKSSHPLVSDAETLAQESRVHESSP